MNRGAIIQPKVSLRNRWSDDGTSRKNFRSRNGRIRIGRAIERDPTIGYSKVDLALRGLEPLALDTLGDAEQDAFIERMGDAPATAAEQDFWRKRQRKGLGVGLDDKGKLEFGKSVRPTGGR